ncbi:ABC-type multidrug transport system, ATPase and permease components [Bellilinea caldifistulae]|uniref:ABC transporter n=1 Tax=Bellilinea caldifistulae TaxID=360411 RepID=A0A0P6WN97_9CHLR|nr:ABC transporter ATP-binding protein [Bellilinea caldifistulae]KPL71505.1 ABC transporter [Bellilinea caldifistulae]GAP10819.1 ABC-type multidrug transport system, ATPase and permease components [Bellilinea caldifistulae]
MGFFAGLDAEKYDRKYSDRELVRRILVYFRPHYRRLILVGLLVLVVSGSGALLPVLVSRGIDFLKQELTTINVLLVPFAVMLTGVIAWLANWQARRLVVRSVADVVARLANEAFASAAEHDLSFYDQFSSGRIASRITSDTQDFGQLVVLTTDLISQVVESLILAIVLINIEWQLSLTLFAVIPIVVLLAASFRGLARKVTRAGMRAMANVNQTIKETVSGIAVAKNFRQEGRIFEIFDQSNRMSYQVNVRRGLVLSMVFPVLNTVGGWMTALLVYVGGLSAVQGAVTVGAWYLFLLSLDRFMFPVMNLSSFWTQIQNGLSAAERVFALIDADPSVVQIGNVKAPPLKGQIDFKHVYFRYKDNEPVLEDFNLHIRPGESVALVGHTGAGKSSVVKLIARFYEFQAGEILIDHLDIRSFDLGSYRCQLGIVSQVPFLFSGTVLENIQYSCKGASPKEIERLAYQIGNGEWLEALPEGLLTQVGERGSRLSMGQRQLVSLMRVLVQKPAIFVLDEATASIDPFTERQIQQALSMVLAQSTSILIAHRLSTVKSADRIIVLDHGKIIEQGTHQELMSAGGHYAELYNTYFRHQSLTYIEQAGKLKEEINVEWRG